MSYPKDIKMAWNGLPITGFAKEGEIVGPVTVKAVIVAEPCVCGHAEADHDGQDGECSVITNGWVLGADNLVPPEYCVCTGFAPAELAAVTADELITDINRLAEGTTAGQRLGLPEVPHRRARQRPR